MTTTKAVAHTQWEISRDAVPEWHAQFTIYEEQSGERVATAFVSEANAQFIVRAANAHYELLAALEELRTLAVYSQDGADGIPELSTPEKLATATEKAIERADAAIRKARGEA